jgi:hypothetical protein
MPGKGNAMGKGGRPADQDRHGGPMGHEGPMGDDGNGEPDVLDHGGPGRGRSESSPGHLKKAAGAQSARDYAPGRVGRAGTEQGED